MTYSEVKAGLNAKLQTIFPMVTEDPLVQTYEYYGLEVVEGYTRPCFFTRLETGESRPINKYALYHRLTYSILYLPAEINEIDIMQKVDEIRNLFELGCYIQTATETRYVDCVGFDWGYGGAEQDILEISIEIEYQTNITKPGSDELMQEVTVKYDYKEV